MNETVSSRALFTRFPQAIFIGLLIFAVLLQWWAAWPLPAVPNRAWFGGGVILVGLVLILWAILEMRALKTSPLPWVQTEALVKFGPYRFSRNPIYLGDVFIMVGLGLVFANTWMLLAAAASMPLSRMLVIRHEEEYMAERFGAEWLGYAERVRRWL